MLETKTPKKQRKIVILYRKERFSYVNVNKNKMLNNGIKKLQIPNHFIKKLPQIFVRCMKTKSNQNLFRKEKLKTLTKKRKEKENS